MLQNVGWTWLLFPFVLVVLWVFASALSYCLAVAIVHFRDTGQIVGIVMQLWFFLTPVMYPVDDDPEDWNGIPLRRLLALNPMADFVGIARLLLYELRLPPLGPVLYCAGLDGGAGRLSQRLSTAGGVVTWARQYDRLRRRGSGTVEEVPHGLGAADVAQGATGAWEGRRRPRRSGRSRTQPSRCRRGSSLGIIGHNGSGKSTALKVLMGIYRPTSGRVTVNGSVSALLEVGAGFHPELTGRENIRLNATILGFTNREIDRFMDQIIEFADIGEHIDAPLKHYSSGMYVRLGFAVAVMVRPEILIVDEVIAVGRRGVPAEVLRLPVRPEARWDEPDRRVPRAGADQ